MGPEYMFHDPPLIYEWTPENIKYAIDYYQSVGYTDVHFTDNVLYFKTNSGVQCSLSPPLPKKQT